MLIEQEPATCKSLVGYSSGVLSCSPLDEISKVHNRNAALRLHLHRATGRLIVADLRLSQKRLCPCLAEPPSFSWRWAPPTKTFVKTKSAPPFVVHQLSSYHSSLLRNSRMRRLMVSGCSIFKVWRAFGMISAVRPVINRFARSIAFIGL